MQINLKILEISLLFILVISLFRSEQITNLTVIFLSGLFLVVFSFISLIRSKNNDYGTVRLWCLVFTVFTIYSFLLLRAVDRRVVFGNIGLHDGVIMTESSYKVLISGRNPYSENLSGVLEREKYKDIQLRETIHFPYSPVMILANVPIFVISQNLFGFLDMRITLLAFFLLAAAIGTVIVGEKILFLILFLFNPLFVPLLFYGANDVFLLFFFVTLVYCLSKKKQILATIILAAGAGTKLLFLPFVPLYFIYLFLSHSKESKEFVLKQVGIFLLTSLIIYLPFLIWNSGDTLNALFSPWIGASDELYPIAGYIGIAQMLSAMGLVSQNTTFPFLIIAIPVEILFLFISFKLLQKDSNLQRLGVLFAFNVLLVLVFSRIVQTYYLAFITEILIFSSLLFSKRIDRSL